MVSFIDAQRERYGVEPICKEFAHRPLDLLRVQGPGGGW